MHRFVGGVLYCVLDVGFGSGCNVSKAIDSIPHPNYPRGQGFQHVQHCPAQSNRNNPLVGQGMGWGVSTEQCGAIQCCMLLDVCCLLDCCAVCCAVGGVLVCCCWWCVGVGQNLSIYCSTATVVAHNKHTTA